MFAIKLKTSEIGYVSIMGQLGEYNALALYIGDEGFKRRKLRFSIIHLEKMIPEPLIGMIIGAIEQGVFPKDIADELTRKLKTR